jgi:hypothetical protein
MGTFIFGENVSFRVLTDKIFCRSEVIGGTLILPYRVEITGFNNYEKNHITKVDVLFTKGHLSLEKNGIKISENIAVPNVTISKSRPSFESQLEFSISHEIISKIEKNRNGDLFLLLSVALQAAIHEEITFPNNQKRSFVSGFDKGHGHINFHIPQSQWVSNILPQTGFDCFKIIELPTTSLLVPKEYKKSLDELDVARKYYLNGDYDKVVAHCRSALDPFKLSKGKIQSYIKSKSEFDWLNVMLEATDEWLIKIVKSTSHFTSKAHHIPSVGHFDQSQAEIITMMTTAIIAYIGRLQNL